MQDDATAATAWALMLLARRDYSRVELEQKLGRKGYTPDVSRQVTAKLAQDGRQSDARFVENTIRSRWQKGYGPRYIRAQLRPHLLDEQMIQAQLAEYDWSDLADRVRVKKFGATLPDTSSEGLKQRAKQMRFLHARGFDEEQMRATFGRD